MHLPINLNNADLLKSDMVKFNGVITEKLPNAEFMVRLTTFPDGSPTPKDQEVRVRCQLLGKLKNKIRVIVFDNVTVGISMETAVNGQGYIVYRERKARVIPT